MTIYNGFDEYGNFHAAMALLWEAYANPECPRRLRQRIVNAIAYLRTQAMAAIPYSATERNYTWDGKRA